MRASISQYASWPALVATCMALAVADPVSAQNGNGAQEPDELAIHVDIEYKQASMAAMVADMSHRFKLSILADGVPLLQKVDLQFDGTLGAALDRVADAFDYSVTIGRHGVVCMMKRFNNPQETPQAMPGEIRQTALDELTILPQLPVDSGDPPRWVILLRQLAKRLPPESIAAMRQGKRLAVSDLAPDNQTTLLDAVRLRAYGDARSMWDHLYRQMDRLDSSVLKMVKQGVFNSSDGKSTAYYDVVHEATSPDGTLTKTSLGGFRRDVRQ